MTGGAGTSGAEGDPTPDRQARLFIAVVPPPDVVAAVMALPRPPLAGVRYARVDQCHVTLRFLGDAWIDAAVDALGRVSASATEAGIGPKVARLGRQVICLPVRGLEAVAQAVVAATGHVGRPPESRPFRGHITVARLGPSAPRRLPDLLDAPFEARFDVGEILLVRSTLDRHGAHYETLAARPLGG